MNQIKIIIKTQLVKKDEFIWSKTERYRQKNERKLQRNTYKFIPYA